MTIQIIKRDGVKEPLDLDKLHKVVSFACEGINNVSMSDIEIKSKISFKDGIKSYDIQETMIKSAVDLITEENSNYQWVAGRLLSYQIRKSAYDDYNPPHIKDIVINNIKEEFYDKDIINYYNDEEWNIINSYIVHDRDNLIPYAGMEQFREKYLVKNRSINEMKESPQIAFMLISCILFKDMGLNIVKQFYDNLSLLKISLSTPVLAGVRTPVKQFSSCVVIDCDDSLDSINASASSVVKYVARRAGIGLNVGRLRGINAPIRKGQVTHTGIIPFLKLFTSAVLSTSQGSIRKGSATFHYPIWHYEIEDLLVLKNNKGTHETRITEVDHSFQFNKLMYQRFLNNEDITLLDPNCIEGLYESFFTDYDKFKELYESAESNPLIRKRKIKAKDLFELFIEERKTTGRIYLQNVDHVNDHTPFNETIYMSNLCQEIALPTKPLYDLNDENGLINLCTLGAINMGKINHPSDFEIPARMLVYALNSLLDYQDYPIKAAKNATDMYRSLGIGITNLAYFLAKNNTNYSNPDLELIDEYMESYSYYLIKASNELAKLKKYKIKSNNNYNKGITPNQTYNKNVDKLIEHEERLDWNSLREDLKEYGIMNATLMAIMPCETSSFITNSTNGIEPPKSLIIAKPCKNGQIKQVVPCIATYKNKYEILYENENMTKGYISICSVIQKYVDQSISVNTSYNPLHYNNEQIPMNILMDDLIFSYYYGIKNLYYSNTNDSQGEINTDDEEECESCIL